MKKLLFILLTFAAMLPWAANAQETLTVYDETNATNSTVPFYGMYADVQGAASEFVIPSEQLVVMEGGQITAITFYITTAATSAWTGTHQVYIGEVDETSLTGITGPSSFTVVSTAQFAATGTELTITFDSPYSYGGGNLLIGTYVSEAGNWKSAYFAGVSQTENTGWYRTTASEEGTGVKFIPKTTFTYTPGAPISCAKPINVQNTFVSHQMAYFTWDDVDGASWQIDNVESGGTPTWTGSTITNHEGGVTGLTANTQYDFYVRRYCSATDQSIPVKVSYTTPPSCPEPTKVTPSFVNSQMAYFTWDDVEGASWQIDNVESGGTPTWTGSTITNHEGGVTGLTANTQYDFYVRRYCSSTDQSTPVKVSYRTDCDPITTIPWNENFDSYTATSTNYNTASGYPNDVLPDCWDFLNRSESPSTYPQVFISSYSSYAVSGNCLFFKSSSTTPLYAILPAFSTNISDLQINFTYRNEGASTSNGTLYVSYMTDPTDASTFNMENAVTCTRTTDKTPMEVLLANAPAGSRIAFKYQGGTSSNYYLAIDEVTVKIAPACPRPTGLAATLTPGDGTVADLSWTEEGEATNWILEYSTADDFTGATSVNVSGTPAQHITGLTAETTYYARVKADCGSEDGQSEWSSTIHFTPTDAYTLTVNDGTTTNQYVPVYGYYCDNYSRGQFIIPAEELTSMQNGFINKMTFYSSDENKSWGNASFKVYCGNTGETTLSALAEWNGLEEVYSGSLSISDNQMVITFDNPYQYLGGNLLIGVNQTVTGTYSSCTWYGVAAPEGASMGGYGDAININKQNFLPKTTFEYTPGTAPSCLKPTGLAVNYTGGTTAEVSWTSDDSAFNIEVNGTVTNNVTNPYTLSGLTLGTVYELRAQANCGSDGTSDWTNPVTFNTDLCIPTEQCEITLALTDNYGDGWNGNAIKVVDVTSDIVLGEFANTSAAEAHEAQIYHLAVCNGREIQFQWVAGGHASETSYAVLGPNGDTIFSGANTMANPVNYTVNCETSVISCESWELVTDNSLEVGDRIIIASKEQNVAMSTTQSTNNRGVEIINKNPDNTLGLPLDEAIQILTLQEGTSTGTFALYTGAGYLYAASSSNNYLRTSTDLNANGSWTISISNDGTASIIANGTSSRNVMQYNQNSSIISCYGSASQNPLVIYKLSDLKTYSDTIATVTGTEFVWHGKPYTESGIYGDTLTGAASNGCDSIVLLHLTLQAPPYTVTFEPGTGTCATTGLTESASGAGVTLPEATACTNPDGYVFAGWSETNIEVATATVPTLFTAGNLYYPTDNTTLYAVYKTEATSEGTPTLDKTNTISDGDQVVIVCESQSKELDRFEDGYSYGLAVNYTGEPQGEYLLTVTTGSTTGTYSFMDEDGNYLCWNSGNSLILNPSKTTNSSWNVTFDSDDNAIIKNASDNTRKLQYNAGNPRFACYTSTQTAVQLYKLNSTSTVTYWYYSTPECGELTYNVTVSTDITNGTVTADPTTAAEGTPITLTATPTTGYHFGLWDVVNASNNPVAVTDNTFNMPASDVTVNAIFWIDTLNITATVNPTDAGMVEGTGAFEYGSDATLVATPAEGFLFSNWTLNGEVVSTNAIYDIIGIEADAAYVANFVAMGQVATPTFSPAAGTYTSEQDLHVTINCATTGATIYYTTDGTTPTETSTVYNTPVEITETTTIKAIATAGNMLPSEVAEATYTINPVYNVLFEDILNGLVTADTLKGVEGDAITLTATPEEGYHFGQWDVVDASNNPVAVTGNTFNMPASDVTVNAIFWIDTLNITATANPTEAGTVTGAGQYEYNTDVTLTATANEGYLFNNWTLNGESVSSSDILTFTALENAAYVANFVAMGQVAAPTFTPAAGTYTSEQDLNVSMNCATTGATIYYTTDGTTPTQTSTVYSTPVEITETTTIKAIAIAENMLPSEVAEATYTINQVYNVYVEETDNGTIGANPSSGVEGTTITLSYTAEDGYTLKKWIVQNGSHEDITVTGNTFNMPASDVYVTAEFVPDTFTVTVVANPTAGGVITSGAGRYAYGEEVSIEFEANPGYEVNHVGMAVESDDEEESDSQFSMPAGNVTVTVYFNPATYSLTIEVGQGRLLNGFVRDNTYTYGEGYNLPGENDVEYAGHTFGGWYGNPDFSGDPITVISTDAYGDSTVYAKWTINTYNITATVNPTNAGMVEGTGEFEYGSDATLVATPLEGFLFENWTLNGEVVSTNAIYDIIGIEADAAFVANFVAMETVSAPVITPNGGTYDSENIPDITVSCETADAIIYYTTDGTDPDENSSVYDGPIIINGTTTVKVLAVAENMLPSEIVTAQFTINQVYYVNVEETDNGTVGAQPSSGVEGTTITLSYTAEDGYTFKKWIVYDSNEEAVTVTGNTFDMPASDVYVSAQFVPDTFTLTIHYMYADNTQAAEDYTEQVAYGDEYSVTSPTVEGHTPSQTVVSGTMPADDYEETVFYSTNSHSLTIHYVYADNSEAHADVVNNYNFGVEYSVESPVIEGYTADITTVSGTMGNDNIEVVVTYTVNSHTLTINYVFEDESEAANTHTETLDYQEEYEVASPELATYMPDQAIVSGTMGDEDVTVTVTYTQIVMDAIDNVVVCNGISTEDITFSTPVTIGTFTYEWANDNAAIGLAETGTEGSIASFKAVNNGTEPAVANVTVTPTCTYNDMVVVGVPQTFTITVNPTLTSEFNATACDSYYWTEADTTITDEGENDYAHVFTSQYDCDSVVTLHLTLHMTPAEIVTNITNNTSCDETQPNGAISIASPAGDFEYSIDNQNWQTETEFTALAAGDYTLYARPLNSECAQTTTVSITDEIVMPDAAAAFVPGTPSFYCADATIALSGEGSSTGEDYSYAWSGPNNYEGTEMNVTVTTAADGTHSGTYTLVVTNTVTHCSSEATVDVIVNTPTTPDYLFTITTHGDAYANINEGETEVTAVFADPEVHHFLSDCNWTVTNDAQATYNAVGDYTINWTATDDCGNTATTTQTLHVTQNSCGTPIDGDNHSYPTVVLNGTCWMAANLRTTSYTDGRAVPVYYQYQSATAPNAAENVDTYGLLYDWYSAMDVARPSKTTTVQGVCPTGWHIPDDDDFAAISNIDLSALRATDHWLINNADNSTGFTMLPAGQYNADKDRYENLLGNAYFWSATTTNDAEATCHMADCNCSMWYVYPNSKYYGFSVRCVKNN